MKFVEFPHDRDRIAQKLSQRPDRMDLEDGEPLRVEWKPALEYEDIAQYIRAWPDKLVTFVSGRLADDDMECFARRLYEYICEADADGPAFERWRNT